MPCRLLLTIMLLAMPAWAQKPAQQPTTAPLAMLAALPAALLEAQLRAGINAIGRLYQARHMRILAQRPASHAGLRCILLDIGADDGPLTESAICLGTIGALFLKLRVTAPPAAAGALEAALASFAKGLVALLR